MEHRGHDRQRLERTLVLLSSQAVARARREAPPRGRAARRPPIHLPKPEQPARPAEPQRQTAPPVEALPAEAPAPGQPQAEPTLLELELPELDELVDRLDRLEQKLDHLAPNRPLPATRDAFGEWVRLRRWEEMPFSEFLTLRRAGRI
ncbi:MAG: hypothetical protein ACREAA_19160 [Candidatus Polarisedimenticolia bacterium]